MLRKTCGACTAIFLGSIVSVEGGDMRLEVLRVGDVWSRRTAERHQLRSHET